MDSAKNLKFSANLKWLFTERPFLERFAAAAKAGFAAVECPSPYEFEPKVLQQKLSENNLKAVLVNTPASAPGTPGSSGVACHPGKTALFRDDIERTIAYANALDAPIVHLMAGILPADADFETARATYLENVAWAAERAQAANVTMVLEAVNQVDVPGFFLRTLEDGLDVIQQVGSSHVRLLFDVYHCQVSQGDVSRRFDKLLPWIGHIQVADVPRRSEPGTGELRFDYLFKHIAQSEYDGWVGCEYRPLGTTEAGLSWRETLL